MPGLQRLFHRPDDHPHDPAGALEAFQVLLVLDGHERGPVTGYRLQPSSYEGTPQVRTMRGWDTTSAFADPALAQDRGSTRHRSGARAGPLPRRGGMSSQATDLEKVHSRRPPPPSPPPPPPLRGRKGENPAALRLEPASIRNLPRCSGRGREPKRAAAGAAAYQSLPAHRAAVTPHRKFDGVRGRGVRGGRPLPFAPNQAPYATPHSALSHSALL